MTSQSGRKDNRVSTSIDSLVGKPLPVLDQGFVRVVDYMGSDYSIVQAARISYGEGTKKVHEDRGLIRYLMRHHHTTPFEMCEIKFHVRVPMDCWRQWIRHRTANVNEYSTRYSEAIDAAQTTKLSEWRSQSGTNRQGSETELDQERGRELSKREEELHLFSQEVYRQRLDEGVAREQARKDLPLSTYTEAYWKIDLHNLFHFLELRMNSHAQLEIRQYANTIGNDVVSCWCPLAWEAFVDYRLMAQMLSDTEWKILRATIAKQEANAKKLAAAAGFLEHSNGKLVRNRERRELEEKLQDLGLPVPWAELL